MNKRGLNQYSGKRRSFKVITVSWLMVFLSLLLLVPAGSFMMITLGSFRSCSVNDAGITLSSCGKSSVNASDLLLLAIFAGVLIIVISAVVHAVRMTRRPA